MNKHTLLAVTLCLALLAACTPATPTIAPTITPSLTPPLPIPTITLTPYPTPTPLAHRWKGIIPGVSNREAVISILGEPDEIKKLSEEEEIFRYYVEVSAEYLEENPIYATYPNYDEIYLKSDIVYLIVEDFLIRILSEGTKVTPEQIFDHLGKPEAIAWGVNIYTHRALLYCNQGTIIFSTKTSVRQALYFEPMNTSACFETFSDRISKNTTHYPPDVIPGPLDIWGIMDE